MARKVFYNNRRKAPKWTQSYLLWFLIYTSLIIIVILTAGLEKKTSIISPNLKIDSIKINLLSKYDQSRLAFFKKIKPQSYLKKSLKCGGLLFERGSGDNLYLIFDARSQTTNELAATFLENLNRHKARRKIQIVLEESPNCAKELNFSSKDLLLRFSNKQLILTSNGTISSHNWKNFFLKEIEYNSIDQFISLAMPINSWDNTIPKEVAHFSLSSNQFKSEESKINLLKKIRQLEETPPYHLKNESIWITENYALSENASYWIIGGLILLIWLPFIHRSITTKESIDLFLGLMNLIFYSLVPLLFFIITSTFGGNKPYIFLIATIIVIGFTWLINKMINSMMTIEINLTTKLFFWSFLTSIYSIFLNSFTLFLLLPISFLMPRSNSSPFFNIFLSSIALILFFFALIIKVGHLDHGIFLSSKWLLSSFNLSAIIFFIFLSAGFLLFINKSKKTIS